MLRIRCSSRTVTRAFSTSSSPWQNIRPYKPGSTHRKPPKPPTEEPQPQQEKSQEEQGSEQPRRWTFRYIAGNIWATAKIAIGLAIVGHVVTAHGFSIAPSSGPSMLPTLEVSEWLLTSKLHRRGKDVNIGDVVSFWHPVEGHGVVKRIIGMPGDFVLRDTPGAGEGVLLQVPEGHFWAVGDNLPWSVDSRFYGPVPLALIKGKIIAKLWPFKWIENGLEPVEATSPEEPA